MSIEDILKIRHEIDEARSEIYDITSRLYDQLGDLKEMTMKIEEPHHKLSREEFDQWMQHGITIGAKFEIEGITLPYPLTVVGISCDGFVVRDSAGKEYTLYAENLKRIDKFKVVE